MNADAVLRLSPRLTAIASFVGEGLRLADIGTDHALIPISLLLSGRIPFAYALDVNEGPLLRAREHISLYGLEERTELRISDGLTALKPGEAESVLISGMGGELMMRIIRDAFLRDASLPEGSATFRATVREWIFSPHTFWAEFRHFLRQEDLRLTQEELVAEEGKYYLVLKAVSGGSSRIYEEATQAGFPPEISERFGPLLLLRRDPVLFSFLQRERKKEEAIFKQLLQAEGAPAAARLRHLESDLDLLSGLIRRFENE